MHWIARHTPLLRVCPPTPNSAKIRLSLRKNAKRTATTKHYDWALLNNKDVRDKYVLELRNRFETLQEKTEKSTPNDEYENFVNAHLEAAAKYIPTKIKTKYRVPWETLAVREKRALVKTSSAGALGNAEYPFIAIAPRSILARSGRKIKNRKAAGLDEIPPEVWKTRQFDDVLLRHCNAVYNQNPD